MDTELPPECEELPMVSEDELSRLLAVELACECLLAHAEGLERLAAAAADKFRAA